MILGHLLGPAGSYQPRPVTGANFVIISARSTGMKFKKQNQNAENKLVSFATIVAFNADSCNFTVGSR